MIHIAIYQPIVHYFHCTICLLCEAKIRRETILAQFKEPMATIKQSKVHVQQNCKNGSQYVTLRERQQQNVRTYPTSRIKQGSSSGNLNNSIALCDN